MASFRTFGFAVVMLVAAKVAAAPVGPGQTITFDGPGERAPRGTLVAEDVRKFTVEYRVPDELADEWELIPGAPYLGSFEFVQSVTRNAETGQLTFHYSTRNEGLFGHEASRMTVRSFPAIFSTDVFSVNSPLEFSRSTDGALTADNTPQGILHGGWDGPHFDAITDARAFDRRGRSLIVAYDGRHLQSREFGGDLISLFPLPVVTEVAIDGVFQPVIPLPPAIIPGAALFAGLAFYQLRVRRLRANRHSDA